jgi:hypothetical protein
MRFSNSTRCGVGEKTVIACQPVSRLYLDYYSLRSLIQSVPAVKGEENPELLVQDLQSRPEFFTIRKLHAEAIEREVS